MVWHSVLHGRDYRPPPHKDLAFADSRVAKSSLAINGGWEAKFPYYPHNAFLKEGT